MSNAFAGVGAQAPHACEGRDFEDVAGVEQPGALLIDEPGGSGG